MSSSVCPCTLLELHAGSPWQQPTGAISAHVMALTHKPSFGRSVSQKRYKSSWLKGKGRNHMSLSLKTSSALDIIALFVMTLLCLTLHTLK